MNGCVLAALLASLSLSPTARPCRVAVAGEGQQCLSGRGDRTKYEYDANGLRTKKVEAGVETRFVLDGPTVLAELDGTNTATRRYLNNPEAIDDLLAFEEGGAVYFPLADALGSVVAIADGTGAIVRRNSYEVYGARTTSGTGPALAFGFTGREHDASGLVSSRQRYLDPEAGIWTAADPLSDALALLAPAQSAERIELRARQAALAAVAQLNNYMYGPLPTSLRDPTGQNALVVLIILLALLLVVGVGALPPIFYKKTVESSKDVTPLLPGLCSEVMTLPGALTTGEVRVLVRPLGAGRVGVNLNHDNRIFVSDQLFNECQTTGQCNRFLQVVVGEYQHTRAGGSADDSPETQVEFEALVSALRIGPRDPSFVHGDGGL